MIAMPVGRELSSSHLLELKDRRAGLGLGTTSVTPGTPRPCARPASGRAAGDAAVPVEVRSYSSKLRRLLATFWDPPGFCRPGDLTQAASFKFNGLPLPPSPHPPMACGGSGRKSASALWSTEAQMCGSGGAGWARPDRA
jgi:hypothetical protein